MPEESVRGGWGLLARVTSCKAFLNAAVTARVLDGPTPAPGSCFQKVLSTRILRREDTSPRSMKGLRVLELWW